MPSGPGGNTKPDPHSNPYFARNTGLAWPVAVPTPVWPALRVGCYLPEIVPVWGLSVPLRASALTWASASVREVTPSMR